MTGGSRPATVPGAARGAGRLVAGLPPPPSMQGVLGRMRRRRHVVRHSHSMVAGGLELMSYTTRLTPGTSLMIRVEMRASTS